MRSTPIIAALALAVVVGACHDSDGIIDPAENSAADPQESPTEFEPQAGGSVVGELETPTGSRLVFIELTAGNAGSVLIVEEGDEGTLVADRIFDAAGEVLSASELYASLIDPADHEAKIPQRLLDLSRTSVMTRPTGWALDLLQKQPDPTLFSSASASSSATIACNNASFTGSIGGGFLARTRKRLDTGPKLHPNLWPSSWIEVGPWPGTGYHIYRYRAAGWATNTPLWSAKVCGKAGPRPPLSSFRNDYTYLTFQYRYGGKWWTAGPYAPAFLEGYDAKVVTWYYDGGIGRIDWDIAIWYAADTDQFDLLMTFN